MQHEQDGLLLRVANKSGPSGQTSGLVWPHQAKALTLRWDVRKQLATVSWAVASKTMRGIVRPVT